MKRLLLLFLIFQPSAFGMGSERVLEFLQKKEVAKDILGLKIVEFLNSRTSRADVKKWGGEIHITNVSAIPLTRADIEAIKKLVYVQNILSVVGKIKPFAQIHKDQALFYSAKLGNRDLVELFLKIGANPNAETDSNIKSSVKFVIQGQQAFNYPIFHGVINKNVDILKLLLEYGANPDLKIGKEPDIKTPLLLAAQNGNVESVKLLINGVNLVKYSQLESLRDDKTLYFSLLPSDIIKRAKSHLENKADLDLYDQGQRALSFAQKGSGHKYSEIVTLLKSALHK